MDAVTSFSQHPSEYVPEIPEPDDLDGWRRLAYLDLNLRTRPLFLSNGEFICANLKGLERLPFDGPYYHTLNACDPKSSFFDYIGPTFEKYILKLTRHAFGPSMEQITLDNGTPLNDFSVWFGKNHLLVAEVKSQRPTAMMNTANVPLTDLNEFHSKIKSAIKQLGDRITEFRNQTGFDGRVTPVLLTLGFIPVEGLIWEMLNSEIANSPGLHDPRNDYLIISDPVAWEFFCGFHSSTGDGQKILDERMDRTHNKTADFKQFLYRNDQFKGHPNKPLISLFESFANDLFQKFAGPGYKGAGNPDLWREVFL